LLEDSLAGSTSFAGLTRRAREPAAGGHWYDGGAATQAVEEFAQADCLTARHFGGTGLAITRKLARVMVCSGKPSPIFK
jgi:hypothetical protein